jgi:hypothetical protein
MPAIVALCPDIGQTPQYTRECCLSKPDFRLIPSLPPSPVQNAGGCGIMAQVRVIPVLLFDETSFVASCSLVEEFWGKLPNSFPLSFGVCSARWNTSQI